MQGGFLKRWPLFAFQSAGQQPVRDWTEPMTEFPKVGQAAGNRGKGRVKGVPNKTTALLKDAILQAAEAAGGNGGLVGYLKMQATENPGPFMSLLGKVLPMQIVGDPDAPIIFAIQRQIVDPKQ